MRIAHAPSQLDRRPRAVAIGTFDGVHRGHRSVLGAAIDSGLEPTVITLDPHPRIVLGNRVDLITTLERRLELLAEAGVADTLVAAFTPEFMRLSPDEFIATYLTSIGAEAVAVGEDFRFGHRRAGSVATLVEAGLEVLPVEEIVDVSSTAIRDAVRRGDLAASAAMLGRPFELDGVVVAGDQRGGTLGYPTANIAMDPQLVSPRYGIYAGEALGHRAAVSIGTNPHYGGTERRIEPYLLDFDGDLYGRRLVVELWTRLRDEEVFESEQALVAQIARDVEATRAAARPVLAAASGRPKPEEHRLRCVVVVRPGRDHLGAESRALEQVEPRVLGEDAEHVPVVDDPGLAARLVEDDGEVDLVRGVRRIRIGRPLDVAERAAVRAVVAAMVCPRHERLTRAVGHEQGDAAGARVGERRRDAGRELVLRSEISDRVVDEDDVEAPPEPQRAHVAEDVVAFRVELAAQRQHLRREVRERAREVMLQVGGVVAAARAQLEQRPRVRKRLDDRPAVALGLPRVVLGCRQKVEPGGELAVEAHHPIIPSVRTRRVPRRREGGPTVDSARCTPPARRRAGRPPRRRRRPGILCHGQGGWRRAAS